MSSEGEYTYLPTTREWLADADLATRKKHGQYMTPKEVGDALIKKVGPIPKHANVLDPAVGTAELLNAFSREHSNVSLSGWEVDPTLAEHARASCPEATVTVTDSLHAPANPIFDVVVGNPPFFEFSPNNTVKKQYADVIGGRVNIYGLFFKVGLDALKPGGTLAYIVPPSMNTGAYFDRLRTHILQHATIESLTIVTEHNMFDQAQVVIQMIVLKKRLLPLEREHIPLEGRYHYTYCNDKYRKTFFCENAEPLRQYFTAPATSNLADLGYTVKTGTIIWNEKKNVLGNDPSVTDAKQLFWSKDIGSDNALTLSDKVRYRYIASTVYDSGPAILSNRIVGAVGNPHVKFAYVGQGVQFLAENHVNVIVPTPGVEQKLPLRDVYNALCSTDFSTILKSVTGSTQLSSKELNFLLRISTRR